MAGNKTRVLGQFIGTNGSELYLTKGVYQLDLSIRLDGSIIIECLSSEANDVVYSSLKTFTNNWKIL